MGVASRDGQGDSNEWGMQAPRVSLADSLPGSNAIRYKYQSLPGGDNGLLARGVRFDKSRAGNRVPPAADRMPGPISLQTMSDRLPLPVNRVAALDLYFTEHRAKLLDIAAFLDRIDRAEGAADPPDFRLLAVRRALQILSDGRPQRARRILELLSDPTTDPVADASAKGATGAWGGIGGEGQA